MNLGIKIYNTNCQQVGAHEQEKGLRSQNDGNRLLLHMFL